MILSHFQASRKKLALKWGDIEKKPGQFKHPGGTKNLKTGFKNDRTMSPYSQNQMTTVRASKIMQRNPIRSFPLPPTLLPSILVAAMPRK